VSWEAQLSHQAHRDQRMTSQSLFPVHRPRQIYGIYKRSGDEGIERRRRVRWNDRAGGEERRAARNEDQRRSSRGLEMEAQRRQRRVRVTEKSRDETK